MDIAAFINGIRPTERISVAEWADRHRYLAIGSSSMPGRYQTARTPYMRKIMECMSAHLPYKKIVLMKGAQVGATEAASNFIGYAMHVAPAPIMMVQPTEDMVKKISRGRIDTLIAACPELAARVAMRKSKSGENTITQKWFQGGQLYLAGANSAAGLRSVPVRYLILDEVDAYPDDLDGEGSPIELAIARTRTFAMCKIFIISTPTTTGVSAIEREFLETDQHYYHVPCPHCGEYQKLSMENLKWKDYDVNSVLYHCQYCGAGIDESRKTEMLAQGKWLASKPELSSNEAIGFHLSSLYSPYGWHSWRQIAMDFIKCKENPNRLKTFVNTTLGETWKERGEAPPYKNLYNRRETYQMGSVCNSVVMLTAGVDVQKDRLEMEVVGWCADKSSYSIEYMVLEGDTALPKVWDDLSNVLERRYIRHDGVEMPIVVMAVDTGYNTSHVYDFCRRFRGNRVIPIKGVDNMQAAYSPPRSVDINRTGRRIGKLRQWNVGVSFLKAELYSWLALERDENGVAPPCYCHFPQYSEGYFRGLTAEEHVRRMVRGYPRYQWEKTYDRNEPLDCRVYARAAAAIAGLDRIPANRMARAGSVSPSVAARHVSDTAQDLYATNSRVRKERKASTFW